MSIIKPGAIALCWPEEVLGMVYFLGCDVSKRKLDLSLINEQGLEQWCGEGPNSVAGIAGLLLSVAGDHPGHEVRCVVESTGCYHRLFATVAYGLGLECLVYNPIITRQQLRATIRGKKTDRTDALMIARLGLRGEGRLYVPESYSATKYYARGHQRLGQLNVAFCAYQSHVQNILGASLSPEAVRALEAAQQALQGAKHRFRHDMVTSAPLELSSRLQSIPGVGPFVAASLIGEIQDIGRFKTNKQLTAYVGLDPRIKQSGHTLNTTGRLTKRGTPYLRRSLFLAANIARLHDPNFKALYDKKRTEGKTYTVATCAVARKLLAVARAVWLSGQSYDPVRMGVDMRI